MALKRFIKLTVELFAMAKSTVTKVYGKVRSTCLMHASTWSSVHLHQSLANATIASRLRVNSIIANSVTVAGEFCCVFPVLSNIQCHAAQRTQLHSPTKPSIDSRMKSAWPLCRAYSSIMCTKIQRKLGDSPLGHFLFAS